MYIHDILTQMEEKINILYAEDNTTAAMIYTEILEEAGYTVTLAKEGNKAWQLYETGTWDLLLLDMDLPRRPSAQGSAAGRRSAERRAVFFSSQTPLLKIRRPCAERVPSRPTAIPILST